MPAVQKLCTLLLWNHCFQLVTKICTTEINISELKFSIFLINSLITKEYPGKGLFPRTFGEGFCNDIGLKTCIVSLSFYITLHSHKQKYCDGLIRNSQLNYFQINNIKDDKLPFHPGECDLPRNRIKRLCKV